MSNQNSTLREVLCDRRTYKTFRYAAWLMIPVALIFLVALTPIYDEATANNLTGVALLTISGCVGVVGAFAGMVLFLGMLAYLFLLDRSSWKFLWLVIFLFTACFGSSIYFFAVYRKQVSLPQASLPRP